MTCKNIIYFAVQWNEVHFVHGPQKANSSLKLITLTQFAPMHFTSHGMRP